MSQRVFILHSPLLRALLPLRPPAAALVPPASLAVLQQLMARGHTGPQSGEVQGMQQAAAVIGVYFGRPLLELADCTVTLSVMHDA